MSEPAPAPDVTPAMLPEREPGGGGPATASFGSARGPLAIPGLALPPTVRRAAPAAAAGNPDPVEDFRLMYRGSAKETGIGVLYVEGWSELSVDEQQHVLLWAKESDQQYGARLLGPRQSVSAAERAKGNRVAAVGRGALGLESGLASGHTPDMTGGASFDAPQIGLPDRVNSSFGGQWKRYEKGYTFAGLSIVDADTGTWIYDSGALNDAPPDVTTITGYSKPSGSGKAKESAASKPGKRPTVAGRAPAGGPAAATAASAPLSEAAGGLSRAEQGALAQSAHSDLPTGANRTMHLIGTGIAVAGALVSAFNEISSAAESVATVERILAGGEGVLGDEVADAKRLDSTATTTLAALRMFDKDVAAMCGPGGAIWTAARSPAASSTMSAELDQLNHNLHVMRDEQQDLLTRVDAAIKEAEAKQKAAELLTDDPATRTIMSLAKDGSEADRVTALMAYESWTKIRGALNSARRKLVDSIAVIDLDLTTLEPWTDALTDAAVKGGKALRLGGVTARVVDPAPSSSLPAPRVATPKR